MHKYVIAHCNLFDNTMHFEEVEADTEYGALAGSSVFELFNLGEEEEAETIEGLMKIAFDGEIVIGVHKIESE